MNWGKYAPSGTPPSVRPSPPVRSRFLCARPSGGVTNRRREVELSVERPLGPTSAGGGTVRLSVRFEGGEEGARPTPAELQRELEALTEDLNALVGPGIAALPAARPDRALAELVDTYRPRQRELIDLLREEGELTDGEHARLVEYLASVPERPLRAPGPVPPSETERLLATVPIERPVSPPPRREPEPSGSPSPVSAEGFRPVPELLRTYQISSLRQAGAVRARRQISFAEYMALKRYFEEEARATSSAERPAT